MTLKICKILKGIEKHRDLIDEAYEVFNSGSAGKDKELITKLFEKTNKECKTDISGEDVIKLRLCVIKVLYGILTGKQGIEALSRKIHEVSGEKDEADIKERFKSFFCLYNHEKELVYDEGIYEIIYNEHEKYKGKEGEEKTKKTISFATKYAYFLTGHEFPIYDRFVVRMLKILSGRRIKIPVQGERVSDSKGIPDNFFEAMYKISNQIGENGIDKFDAFCWVWGKVAESKDGMPNVFNKDKSKEFCDKLKDRKIDLIREEN